MNSDEETNISQQMARRREQIILETLPKHHAHVLENLPDEYSDYEGSTVSFGRQDDYEISTKIGRGRYSEVYKGINLLKNDVVAIKILKPGKFLDSFS